MHVKLAFKQRTLTRCTSLNLRQSVFLFCEWLSFVMMSGTTRRGAPLTMSYRIIPPNSPRADLDLLSASAQGFQDVANPVSNHRMRRLGNV